MDMNRRGFIRNVGIIGCSAAASPLVTPVTFAAAPQDTRLVVIILRGAMDGLDVVQPYGDRNLRQWRPGLSIGPEHGAHDLDGFFALHPALGDLMPLWRAGELGFVHAVSTPYRDKRSHFDGQDFLENGGFRADGSIPGPSDGWLNRLLPLIGAHDVETAFAVGRERLMLLQGDAPHSSWSPDADLDLSSQARLLLDLIYREDPLFHDAAMRAADLSENMSGTMGAAKAGRARALAEFAAERLNGKTRIAAFSLSGWDTHRGQKRALAAALTELQTAILTLRSGLGRNWQNTAVLAITEFGRTVRENGSGGTDHGTGGAMVMAGGAVRGGAIHGAWPGLEEADLYQRRDLMPTDDLRRYAGWVMAAMFGVGKTAIGRDVFPALDMGVDPRIIL